MYPDHMFWGGMWMFPPIFFLVFLIAVPFIFWHFGGRYPRDTPMDILKKRYAKGEISKEEFEKIKKDLLS